MTQVNRTICIGMGTIANKKLKLYVAGAKERGYHSFSAFVVALLERELEKGQNGSPAKAPPPNR